MCEKLSKMTGDLLLHLFVVLPHALATENVLFWKQLVSPQHLPLNKLTIALPYCSKQINLKPSSGLVIIMLLVFVLS